MLGDQLYGNSNQQISRKCDSCDQREQVYGDWRRNSKQLSG
jgi:hypothetical protein